MMSFTKILGRDNERKSRLHTRRGQFAISGLSSALRSRNAATDAPWMAPGSVERLNRILTRDMTLLELGSGSSTAWYAARVRSVVSIEPDPIWAARVADALSSTRNASIVTSTVESALPVAQMTDVVVVDHNDEIGMTRVDAVRLVSGHAKMVVLDDSDRREYREVDSILDGWHRERYVGFRPRPLVPTETTIFIRPDVDVD